MIRLLKSQASSLVGTAVDYAAFITLVECIGLSYIPAGTMGNILGAITQFTLARNFVFEKTDRTVRTQVFKYILVWMGYLIMSAIFLNMFMHEFGLHYLVSKILISVSLGLGYNYVLQKNFVFA